MKAKAQIRVNLDDYGKKKEDIEAANPKEEEDETIE